MYYRLHELIARSARERGDRPALTYGDTTLSYAELWEEVRRAAAAFRRLGLRRGDRVAIYLEKRVETVVAIFGAAAAGLVFVPVNPLLRPKQVGQILSTSGSTGLPKGIVLSHRNMLAGATSVAEYLGNDADDVILAALPLSFDA